MNLKKLCAVCADDEIRFAYSSKPNRIEWKNEGRFDVWQCTRCSHRFINPSPSLPTLTRCYSSQYGAYQAGHGTGDLERACEDAKRDKRYRHVELSPDADVLDVGCGSGSFLYVIRDLVHSVQGVEPSEHGVKTCERLSIPVFHGDLENFNLTSDQKFDLITLNHVLEHHPEPMRLLALCRMHLKQNGLLWIAVPNAGCFFAQHLEGQWHSADIPVHLQQFTTQSLSLALKLSGLGLEESRTESENSLVGSACTLLRRFGVPARFASPMLTPSLSKTGWLGRRIDESGNGEAILMSARN